MAAVTYTAAPSLTGPTFTCTRCTRVYAYPADHGRPIRCECGWWYYNIGHGKFVEEYKPRIGGPREEAPTGDAAVADESAIHH